MSDVVFKYGGPAPTRRCARCAGFELDNAVLRDALLAAWDALEEAYENVPTCPATEKLAIAFRACSCDVDRLLAMETAVSASKSFEERAERAERERDEMVRDEPGYADLLLRVQAERDAVFRLYDGDEATLNLVREAGVRGDTAPLPRRWAKEIAKAERERDYHMRQYVCAAHVIEDAWAAQGDKARTTGGLADAVATLRRERDELRGEVEALRRVAEIAEKEAKRQFDRGQRYDDLRHKAERERDEARGRLDVAQAGLAEEHDHRLQVEAELAARDARLTRERDSWKERAEYAEKALKEKP